MFVGAAVKHFLPSFVVLHLLKKCASEKRLDDEEQKKTYAVLGDRVT